MSEPPASSLPTPEPSARRPEPNDNAFRPHSVHVIINPATGQDLPILPTLNQVFKEYEVDWEAFVTKNAGDARRYARASALNGVDLVMACGGDGTVMEAASGLRGIDVPLAILPCGTANVMSIELNISADLPTAAALAVNGQNRLRWVDMGEVQGNGDFLLRIGVGMEAHMVIETPREAKTRWGGLAYLFTALNQLAAPPVARYIMNLDGLHVEAEGISLMVANSGNVGLPGIKIVEQIDVSDGLLDVVLIRPGDLPGLLATATNVLLNRQEEPGEAILHWQAREIQIDAEPQQPTQTDGEPIGTTPLTARVLPHAVQVVCPP